MNLIGQKESLGIEMDWEEQIVNAIKKNNKN